MEFPYGHHHHHHQHHERRDEEEERYGRYPPPINDEPTWPPPAQAFQPPTYPPPNRFDSESNYPSVHHVSHHHYQPEPEPDYASVHHVSHESHPHFRPEHEPGYASVHHVSHESHPHFRPEHEPGYASVHHVSHQSHQGFDPVPYAEFRPETYPHSYHGHEGSGSELLNKPTCRVYSKAETGYSLTIRDGHVILARANENDPFQHWIKYEKFSTKVKDQEGFPSFSLVNKATGQAMKHSIGATQPVQLIPYNPDVLDESVLWTESKDLGDGYRAIRMVNNIRLNLDAFNGDQNHGGVHDGTTIVLWEWKKGDNQRWRISPNCKYFNTSEY